MRATLIEVDGEKVRQLRHQRLMLRRDLAEAAGLHLNTIGKIERGEGGTHPDTIRKLGEALGVPPATLLAQAPNGTRSGLPRAV
jgi:transcriptional regulator with XRE-family HTH domain